MIQAKDLRMVTQNLSVIYAEDEEWLRENMTSTLFKLFKEVHVAKDGQEALEIYKANDVDLLITDINMPNMSGDDLIAEINNINKIPFPTVVLTAHNEVDLLQKLIDLNVSKFLNKPVEKQKMIDALYGVCKSVWDAKMIKQYEADLEKLLQEANKKNRILETKLQQIAKNTNAQSKVHEKKAQQTKEQKKEISEYFDALTSEDRDELLDLSEEMDSYIALMFQQDIIDKKYFEMLAKAISQYGRILNQYSFFYDIGIKLLEFTSVIEQNFAFIQDNQQDCALLMESLQFTLEEYRNKVWLQPFSDPCFFNASIVKDVEYIINFVLNKNESTDMEFF